MCCFIQIFDDIERFLKNRKILRLKRFIMTKRYESKNNIILGTQSPGHSVSLALGLLGTKSTGHSVHLGTHSGRSVPDHLVHWALGSNTGNRQGKITSTVFRLCHEECQEALKLHVVKEYLGNETNLRNKYRRNQHCNQYVFPQIRKDTLPLEKKRITRKS